MSELLQSGHHPDADQLSAFIEQALPLHERKEMLSHLAVCLECRETVALSLPAISESPRLDPVPVRKPWFSGWNLAWPAAAAALAAMAVFVIYIHRVSSVRNESPSTTQTAASQRPGPPVPARRPPAPLDVPQAKQAQSQASRQIEDLKSETSRKSELKGKGQLRDKDLAQLPIAGRNLLSEKKLAEAGPAAPSVSQAQQTPGPAAASGASSEGRREDGTAQAMNKPLAVAPSTAPANAFSAAGALGGNSLTAARIQQMLPSGLPVLSMATHEQQILAIDSHNTVYLSRDGGQHWMTVPAQWKGRAVSATLVSYGLTRVGETGKGQGGMAAGLASQERVPAATPGSSLSGIVTDMTGAVIPGATLKIIDGGGHTLRTVTTDQAGQFLIDGLVAGSYRIEAEARGFSRQTLTAVPVSASGTNVMNIQLQVGAMSETVTVDAESVPLDELQSTPKGKAKPASAKESAPVFEILTENGDRWTSSDGMTWKRK